MAQGFEGCVEQARFEGLIDDDTADGLLARFRAHAKTKGSAGAKAALSKELAMEGAEKRRRDTINITVTDQIKKDIAQYRSPKGNVDLANAVYNLFEGNGYAGYQGVRQVSEALIGKAHAEMGDFLAHFSRKWASGGRRNMADLDAVLQASYGKFATKPPDEKSKALYQSWRDPVEKLRELANAAGYNIGHRDDWGLPQRHNAEAILRAGFEKWSGDINKWLGWDRMQMGGAPILDEDRADILRHGFESIVTDGWNLREPSKNPAKGSMASDRSDPRFFIFKDPESWKAYAENYGTGDVFGTMMGHVTSLARDVGMMQRLGTNPAATTEWLKQIVAKEGANRKIGKPSTLAPGILPTGVDAKVATAHRVIDGFYKQFKGEGEAATTLGLVGTILRNDAMGALLGSAVIPHMAINPIIQLHARYIAGMPLAKMIPTMARSFGHGAEDRATRAGLILEDALHVMGAGARESGALARAANWTRWLPDRTTHWSGLVPLVNAFTRAYRNDFMGLVADNIAKPLDQTNPRMREVLRGWGITPQDWRIMQMAAMYKPDPRSAPMMRWDNIRDVGINRPDDVLRILGGTLPLDDKTSRDMAAKAAEAVAVKYLGVLAGLNERGTPKLSMRARGFMLGGSSQNRPLGFIARSASMFHGFMGSFMLGQISTIAREMAANKAKGAAYAASLFILCTLGGMLSQQLKQMRSGKDMLPMDPTTREGMNAWVGAMLTGGGWGLLGDFVHSSQDSFGHGPLEQLAGPVVGTMVDMYEGLIGLLSKGPYEVIDQATGEKRPKRSLATSAVDQAVKIAGGWTPLLSTFWPTMAAYHRVALDQAQFAADPHASQMAKTRANKMRRETGQTYWWKPGELTPDHFPQFSAGKTPLFGR